MRGKADESHDSCSKQVCRVEEHGKLANRELELWQETILTLCWMWSKAACVNRMWVACRIFVTWCELMVYKRLCDSCGAELPLEHSCEETRHASGTFSYAGKNYDLCINCSNRVKRFIQELSETYRIIGKWKKSPNGIKNQSGLSDFTWKLRIVKIANKAFFASLETGRKVRSRSRCKNSISLKQITSARRILSIDILHLACPAADNRRSWNSVLGRNWKRKLQAP